jgi:hypothetical protein
MSAKSMGQKFSKFAPLLFDRGLGTAVRTGRSGGAAASELFWD